MIAYLEGTVLALRRDRIILKAGPIGYEVFVTRPKSCEIGQFLSLYCYQQFKEDGQFLYGFETEEEYDLFTLLIQVKGVGCRTVLNALAAMDCQTIARAIEQADTATLKKLPGIGAKTAGQIILDLKGKIVLEPVEAAQPAKKKEIRNPVFGEVADALISLGFRPAEIEALQITPEKLETMSVNALLHDCLRELGARKRMN